MSASLIIRFKAFMIDYSIIIIYLLLLLVTSVFLYPQIQYVFTGSPATAQLAGFLLVTMPVSVYFIVGDSAMGGQTFGKRAVEIRTVTEAGEPVSVFRAIVRTALKFLPWELSHFLVYRLMYLEDTSVPIVYYILGGTIYALMFAYILTAIFTRKKQTLYDLIVQTKVVKR
ncbi:hypothetical protein CR205_11835 [Alteribacter lacisalsi]|uniref:RDD domain-containing protein n=1 Tax=Alteribacter lacisalsi TaxID=2045244 RepID=A0A2W0HS65_9BACI|nr:RDD family protein [Alteribacter lacisalsi]PYZ96408.1 hypothetical protein CR205_11835 [Alteribacter lacisalsi]